ncbi:MAG: DUF4912 domain-containing protein [Chitinispirillaceae bacterium]|nr:DUF4912 domain-containing protein [Chitinispirillaceae bacterium]
MASVKETDNASGAKSPLPPRPAAVIDRAYPREIPALYNETYLRALPREEGQFFSFWEISAETLRSLSKGHPEISPKTWQTLIRIYEVEQRGAERTERPVGSAIPVGEGEGSRYLQVPREDREYRVELGMQSGSGTYAAVCSSEDIRMPAARVQEIIKHPDFHADTPALTRISLENASAPVVAEAGGSTEQSSTGPRGTVVTSPVSPWSDHENRS